MGVQTQHMWKEDMLDSHVMEVLSWMMLLYLGTNLGFYILECGRGMFEYIMDFARFSHSVPMSPRRGVPLMSFVCAVMSTASPSS